MNYKKYSLLLHHDSKLSKSDLFSIQMHRMSSKLLFKTIEANIYELFHIWDFIIRKGKQQTVQIMVSHHHREIKQKNFLKCGFL